jgi:hypothetical protein
VPSCGAVCTVHTFGRYRVEASLRLADRRLHTVPKTRKAAVPEGLPNACRGVGVRDRYPLAVECGLGGNGDEQVERLAVVRADVPPAHAAARERTARCVSDLLGDHNLPGVQVAIRVGPLHGDCWVGGSAEVDVH